MCEEQSETILNLQRIKLKEELSDKILKNVDEYIKTLSMKDLHCECCGKGMKKEFRNHIYCKDCYSDIKLHTEMALEYRLNANFREEKRKYFTQIIKELKGCLKGKQDPNFDLDEYVKDCIDYYNSRIFDLNNEEWQDNKKQKKGNFNKSVPKSEEAFCMTDREFIDDSTSTELKKKKGG